MPKIDQVHLLLILLTALLSIFGGRPAEKAEIYLEKGTELIAYQQTGEKGKVSFNHLDAGSYRLLVIFPQQDGKYIKEKPKHRSLTKATYNSRNKTYYYQGKEGFFAIHFSGISNIKSENFQAVYKEERDEEDTDNLIILFGAHRNNASVKISVSAITAAQFQKASEKAGTDISTLSIPNIR